MKVSKTETDKIIEGLIGILPENMTEAAFAYRHELGAVIMARGGKKDATGRLYVPEKTYKTQQVVRVPVNHRRRLLQIIKSASDKEALETLLAAYTVKYKPMPRSRKQ